MRDGKTHKKKRRPAPPAEIEQFLDAYRVKVVVVSGAEAGAESELFRATTLLGRGPGVHLKLDDPAISRQHAAIEYADGEFRIRDLGSTNGVLLNGQPVQVGELKNGDRFEIGGRAIQLVIEQREPVPEVYELEV
jgi:pSer/pThr/pTyr-binding forkhead associated (FHA) protein